MFRWLKDRKKGKKLVQNVRCKEDDYGFRQGVPDMKRDLPPTPDVTSASCGGTAIGEGDDRSVHIYEEIPDLPFRCTPEGELRIRLVREASGGENCRASAAARDVSPYMVVPLERLMGTPLEFRLPPRDQPQDGSTFACAVVGRRRACDSESCEDCSTSCTCEGSSTPSWDDSSVFSSNLGAGETRGGSAVAAAAPDGRAGGGDISDRLLSAINLTRLLTAIRLSSSSADTLTTSPICIGVDKDGKNISVSVSVTPVAHVNDTSSDDARPSTSHQQRSGQELESTSGLWPTRAAAGKSARGESTVRPDSIQCARTWRFLPSPSEQSVLNEILQLGPEDAAELDQAQIDVIIAKLCPDTTEQPQRGAARNAYEAAPRGKSFSEGKGSLLDPLRRKCEQQAADLAGAPSAAVEPGLDVTAGSSHRNVSMHAHVQRAENSDTCYEYDLSTSSESDQVSYDYYLAKVQRTRSLECEVQKLIRMSESEGECCCDSEGEQAEECEEEGEQEWGLEEGASKEGNCQCPKGTFRSERQAKEELSALPQAHGRHLRRQACKAQSSAAVDAAAESDDGTMADLSESENSSGYYESAALLESRLAASSGAKEESGGKARERISSVASDACIRGARSGAAVDVRDRASQAACSGTDAKALRGSSSTVLPRDRSRSLPSLTPADASPVPVRRSLGKPCKGTCSSTRKPHQQQHNHHHHHQNQRRLRHRHCRHRSPSRSSRHAGERCRSSDSGLGDTGNKAKEPQEAGAGKGDSGVGCVQTKLGLNGAEPKSRRELDASYGDRDRWTMNGQIDGDVKPKHCPGGKSGYEGPCKSWARGQPSKDRDPESSSQYHYYQLFQEPSPPQTPGDGKGHHSRPHKTTSKASSRSKSAGKADGRRKKGHSGLDPRPAKAGREDESVFRDPKQGCHPHPAGEVYSIPTSLPDPSSTSSYSAARAMKSTASAPRHIPDSSEVYGMRGGTNSSNNRLLSDLILLNYNRQVFNHV